MKTQLTPITDLQPGDKVFVQWPAEREKPEWWKLPEVVTVKEVITDGTVTIKETGGLCLKATELHRVTEISIKKSECDMINQVIEILKKSRQALIFLDSIICPVRQLMGKSSRDHKMVELAEELKERKIIEYYTGYGNSGYLYVSSFVLTEEFFKEHCKPIQRPGKQTTLF